MLTRIERKLERLEQEYADKVWAVLEPAIRAELNRVRKHAGCKNLSHVIIAMGAYVFSGIEECDFTYGKYPAYLSRLSDLCDLAIDNRVGYDVYP